MDKASMNCNGSFPSFIPNVEKEDSDTCKVSVLVPNQNGARITRLAPNKTPTNALYKDATTLVEAVERGCKISGDGRCLGWRSCPFEYSWLTYSEFLHKAQNFGSGLMHIGANLGQDSLIGLFAKTSVEWVIAMYGCFFYSSPIVPLYESLGPDSCTFIINQGYVKCIVCDDEKKINVLLEKKDETPSLECIISIGELSDACKIQGLEKGVSVYSFESILNMGRTNFNPPKKPQPKDVAEICYTSGTTGNPKGVILTHENFIAAAGGYILELGPLAPNKSDVLLSCLPLAHVFQKIMDVLVFIAGGSIGCYSGDINRLAEDMQVLKPTIWPSVPRILNKLYDMAQTKFNKETTMENDNHIRHADERFASDQSFLDRNSFDGFPQLLGDNIRLIITGAAPTLDHVVHFYRKVLGCNVLIGYGLTETAGPCTGNIVTDSSLGHVGPPVSCNMVKLVDVPELSYFQRDGTGEICVKGYNVLKGYYKDPIRTKEIIDEDGWLHTGDIAKWTQNGAIKIIDRKKHILKLSHGEYVAPGKLENIYITSVFISQIFVHGESLKNFLVAVVIPDKDVILRWGKENLTVGSWEELCKDVALKQMVFEDMRKLAQESGLMSYEEVKKIHIHPKLLTLEEEHLTPTLKIRRSNCAKYFAREIEAMYSEN